MYTHLKLINIWCFLLGARELICSFVCKEQTACHNDTEKIGHHYAKLGTTIHNLAPLNKTGHHCTKLGTAVQKWAPLYENWHHGTKFGTTVQKWAPLYKISLGGQQGVLQKTA
jgi:hypothetical protein